MKNFVRMVMLSSVLAVVSAGWLGCVVDNGTGPSSGTAPRITTSTLPGGTAGTAYSQTLKASGDAPITWSLESGALPAGLNLLGSGTISGTPTTAGAYSFSVKAINSAGSDVSSFSVTITGGSTTPTTPTTPTSYSLDGVWVRSDGRQVTVSGSIGVINVLGTLTALGQSALDKGYIAVGKQVWRNLTSTGNLTWSGQELMIIYNTSSPNVATGTTWDNRTFTMSADGQTLTVMDGTTIMSTWTRVSTYSLDGVWVRSDGRQVTVSGSIGVINVLGTLTALGQSAVDKGYIAVGKQVWRNLTSTGNLTWSGQELMIIYNTSSPNVATGTTWDNRTFTMSADGQTLTNMDGTTIVNTWTRYQ